MIAIHIVCTHDGVKLAETLMRLLEAEEHQARLSYGRQSLAALETAKTSEDAVLLIWSADAPTSHYMLEWARQIPEKRLVEIARAPGWPRSARKAPVIDFISWRGARGERAWNALNERLRAIQRLYEPQKPPPSRAALALGVASLAAVTGAVMVRVNMPAPPEFAPEPNEQLQQIAFDDPSAGIGGPLRAVEPASLEELDAIPRLPAPRYAPLEGVRDYHLADLPELAPPELREPTLIERIAALNPLRSDVVSE